VPTLYLILGLATGGLILDALLHIFGAPISGLSFLCLLALGVAAILKWCYWKTIDNAPRETDLASATGLGVIGTVRVLDKPHTSENYLQKEMGFRVARKHAEKLRRIAMTALFAVPIILLGFWSRRWSDCLGLRPIV
jgi:sulfite dehydrogenase (quinone) subunit SoeC